MKRTSYLVLVASVFFYLLSTSFLSAQMDKESCQEILSSFSLKTFNTIIIYPNSSPTNADSFSGIIYLKPRAVNIYFKDSYLVLKDEKRDKTIYLPYNRVKFIHTSKVKRKTYLSIYLID